MEGRGDIRGGDNVDSSEERKEEGGGREGGLGWMASSHMPPAPVFVLDVVDELAGAPLVVRPGHVEAFDAVCP